MIISEGFGISEIYLPTWYDFKFLIKICENFLN